MVDLATPHAESCAAPALQDSAQQHDLLNRLKRAEGQLRGIRHMIEQQQPCLDVANQMAAVRKALDSAYVRLTVCFMQQRLRLGDAHGAELAPLLDELQTLLGKVR